MSRRRKGQFEIEEFRKLSGFHSSVFAFPSSLPLRVSIFFPAYRVCCFDEGKFLERSSFHGDGGGGTRAIRNYLSFFFFSFLSLPLPVR